MRAINLRSMSLFTAGLLVLAFAPASQAALPKTKTNLIVPGKSVAGVKLNMTMKRAGQIWKMEEGNSCFRASTREDFRCLFELFPSGANYHTGNISYYGVKKVKSIVINAPNDGSQPNFSSKMNRYKTKTGVSIGATKAKLRNTFGPRLKRVGSNGPVSAYKVVGPKPAKTTTFGLYGSQVSSISVSLK